MNRKYRMFQKLTAWAGFIILFGAAGTDEYYADLGQMPPDSIDSMVVLGSILLIPMALRLIGMALRKRARR